jgi:hypothetical protein
VRTRKIGLNLPADLVRQAEVYAAEHGTTVNTLVCDLLQEKLIREGRIRAAVDVEKARVTLARLHQVPIVDDCNWDEVLYNETGLPT